MGRFVLDTGILVGYVRDAGYCGYIDIRHRPLEAPNVAVISAVSKGEILSLAIQFRWEDKKKRRLEEILAKIPAVDIHRSQILQRYADIDCYCKGKHPDRPLPRDASARRMGKNDLWIAATASVMGASLLTLDGDFDHLHGIFLDVLRIDQSWTAQTAHPNA